MRPRQPKTGREFNIRHCESSNSEGANNLAIARLLVEEGVVPPLAAAYSSNTNTPEGASSNTVGRKAKALGYSLNNKCVCIYMKCTKKRNVYIMLGKLYKGMNEKNKKKCQGYGITLLFWRNTHT